MGTEKQGWESPEVIDSLYRRYAAEIRRYIGRSLPYDEAHDLSQEVFIRCGSCLDMERPEAHRAFLYRIARNLVIDRLRQIRRERKWIAEQVEQVWSFASSAEFGASRTGESTDLERALAKLGERMRDVFILRELHGFTLKEIGEFLDVGTSTVKRDLERARDILRLLLAGVDRKPNVAA
jgi:RNA polymerase sigma-70 factor (ECF subfamily)